MNDLESTLKERKENYGSYYDGTDSIARIMHALNVVHISANSEVMSEFDRARFFPIVQKLVRASATPSYADSWHDIAGYARLSENLCSQSS